jgi:uncharacterized membrane protein/ribosomal protein S27E
MRDWRLIWREGLDSKPDASAFDIVRSPFGFPRYNSARTTTGGHFMAIFCTSCGTQNADSAVFCSNCGKSITQPAGAAAPAGGFAAAAPPPPMAVGTMPNENVMGGIAYLTFIPAVIFLLIEPHKYNRFVRFHSWQCIWLCIARLVVGIALFWTPFLGIGAFILRSFVGLIFFIAWLIAIVNAFQGKLFKLPVIGDLAESQANKM